MVAAKLTLPTFVRMAISATHAAPREVTTEEEDLLQRSTKRTKENHNPPDPPKEDQGQPNTRQGKGASSYRDKVKESISVDHSTQEDDDDEGNTSDDDLVMEGDGVSWFGMRMTKTEKIEARRPWRNSLIIKLVGRSVGYQFLWKRIQAMWRTQGEPF